MALFFVLLGIWVLFLYMLWHNNQVYRYLMDMLDKVSEAAEQDIKAGRQWMWRYEKLGSVSYQEMVRKPWRSLDSFYPDKSFIDPEAQDETRS